MRSPPVTLGRGAACACPERIGPDDVSERKVEPMLLPMAVKAQIVTMGLVDRLRDRRGQGTIEYVGVVVMVTLLMSAMAVAAKQWGGDVGKGLKGAVQDGIDQLTGEFGKG